MVERLKKVVIRKQCSYISGQTAILKRHIDNPKKEIRGLTCMELEDSPLASSANILKMCYVGKTSEHFGFSATLNKTIFGFLPVIILCPLSHSFEFQ